MAINTHITIFGGTGDLTFRKLLPAFYTMHRTGKLPGDARITIVGRRDYSDETYREAAGHWIETFSRLSYDREQFIAFAKRLRYFRMDFTDIADYTALDAYYKQEPAGEHVFYLAVAPRFFGVIAQGLACLKDEPLSKVVVEKPFGETLAAAERVNAQLEALFGAEGIYRIDHYLGKEMILNIQTIRFDNALFEHVWNSRCIESVTISALEDVGVEERGGYYDASGALKDMVQNHLFQILSILAMEKPESFDSPGIHDAQLEALKALRPPQAETLADTLVLGQYQGYTAEPKVAPDSTTETFAALRLFVDTPRWQGTPFYIRTGKKTGIRQTTVVMTFRHSGGKGEADTLIIEIQPTEGMSLQFNIKRPGDSTDVIAAKMDFCQSCNLENQRNTPEAYERLLTACLKGERTLFSQWDQIAVSWAFVAKLKELAQTQKLPVAQYAQGQCGPASANDLPARFGHHWVEA